MSHILPPILPGESPQLAAAPALTNYRNGRPLTTLYKPPPRHEPQWLCSVRRVDARGRVGVACASGKGRVLGGEGGRPASTPPRSTPNSPIQRTRSPRRPRRRCVLYRRVGPVHVGGNGVGVGSRRSRGCWGVGHAVACRRQWAFGSWGDRGNRRGLRVAALGIPPGDHPGHFVPEELCRRCRSRAWPAHFPGLNRRAWENLPRACLPLI